ESVRYRNRGGGDALAPVDRRADTGNGTEHEGDSQCHEREDLASQATKPEHDQSDEQAEHRREQPTNQEGRQERPALLHDEDTHGIDPDAVEGTLAEAEVPREAGEQIPAR